MKVKVANREMSHTISELRKRAYKVATNATLRDDSFLEWDEMDDKSLVLYIENDLGEVISSMRGILAKSRTDINQILDIDISDKVEYPIFLIDRLTTDISYRRKGLSGIFRYLYIEACLNVKGISNIGFTINDGASRIDRLKRIGFNFERADLSIRKGDYYQNTSDVLLAILNRTYFENAKQIAKADLKIDLSTVEIKDDFYETFHNFLEA